MCKSYIARGRGNGAGRAHNGSLLKQSSGLQSEGRSAAGDIPTAPAPSITCWFYLLLQRPKFIAPTSPNDVLDPSSPIGMLMLGLMLNRELNTNPVPSVRRP